MTDWYRELPQHEERLFWICWGILRNTEMARDAVQQTYAAFLNNEAKCDSKSSKYDSQRPLESWLITIAKRKALDMWRESRVQTRKTVSLAADQDLAEEAVDTELGPEDNAIRTELEDLLNKCCLPGLTDAQREALRLCYHEDLSRSQIAARMGKTESAVGGLLRDGKKRLLAHFQADHPEFVRLVDWSEFNE